MPIFQTPLWQADTEHPLDDENDDREQRDHGQVGDGKEENAFHEPFDSSISTLIW
jgi:hypothetical protein